MSDAPRPSFVTALAEALVARPGRVVVAAVAISALASGLAWHGLRVQTDRMALIGEQHRFNQNFAELLDEFGDVDAMVAVLSAPDRPAARAAADLLAARIAAEPARFPGLYYRVPPEALAGKALLFLDLADLQAIEARLRLGREAVRGLQREGLGGFFSAAADLVERLSAPGADAPADGQALAFLPTFADGVSQALEGQPAPPPWQAWIPPGALAGRDGYTWTDDGRLLLLVQPRREDLEATTASVHRLRALLDALAREAPGVTAGLTGEPVLEVDEMETFHRDAQVATALSLVGVTLLLALSMRRLLGPLLATASLAAALLTTLGAATLWPGRLNLISAAFCALLVGLGIDYAIHWVSRFDEERARGLEGAPAVAAALHATGRAIAAGAITTALAFLATLFTDVEGIREFGVVAGAGVLLALAATTVLLPALVVLADRSRGGRRARPRPAWPRSRLAQSLDALIERRPAAVVGGSLALAAAALAYATGAGGAAPRLRYDPNLLALQAQGLESVQLAGEVLADEGLSGMFCAITCDDPASLAHIQAAVERLPSVSHASSILDVVPPQQPEKLAVLARIQASLADLPARGASPPSGSPQEQARRLEQALEALVAALERTARGALWSGRSSAAEYVMALEERVDTLARAARAAVGDLEQARRLVAYEATLRRDLGEALARLADEANTSPLTIDSLPREVRERFVGRTGKLLLRVYPAVDAWSKEGLRQFVEEVRSVAPDAGGIPVVFYASDRLIRSGYVRAAQLALAFTVLFLLVHFRNALLPAVATATLLVGACWGVGLLALLRIDLNPANLLALPLTCGIGIDYAIHLIHRDREARRSRSLAGAPAIVATATGRAVVLSTLTTLVAFGALTLSAHRGVASIGATICVGVVASLAAALLLCPALLRLWSGPSRPLPFTGLPGPKTGPGGAPIRPVDEGPEDEE